MKKKLMFLSLGVLGFVASFAQPPANLTGVMVNTGPGGTFVQVTANQPLLQGTMIMFGTQMFAIRPSTQPIVNDAIVNVFQNFNVVVDLNANGINNSSANIQAAGATGIASPDLIPGANSGADAFFGTATGRFTVVPVPLDPATTAVLAFGLVAAFITARNRRKQAGILA